MGAPSPRMSPDLRDISLAVLTAARSSRNLSDYCNRVTKPDEHRLGVLEAQAEQTRTDLLALLEWAGVDADALKAALS